MRGEGKKGRGKTAVGKGRQEAHGVGGNSRERSQLLSEFTQGATEADLNPNFLFAVDEGELNVPLLLFVFFHGTG